MPYFGLYIPSKAAVGTTTNANNEQTSDDSFVFDDKSKALVVLKLYKEARLREFNSEDDALKYAQTGYEEVLPPKYADPKSASTAAVEKAAFRAPTKQELIEFRKVIEAGDFERVKTIIWDNPRYLVSSGDTPSTLKEGYRYNALHVCAISKKPRIAELILKTVSNSKFVDLLTGKKNDEKMCKELCANLLDYYLNIPEKGRSETPLHLAAKIGSVEMVEVLTSFPECRMTANNDGNLPKDIICSRQSNASPEVFKKIEKLLEERFYVPVLRSVDNAVPPEIGEPFQANNPPNFNADPLSPEVKIQALAGPMSKDQAQQFRRRWKTPPRMGSKTSSPIANNPFISPRGGNHGNTTPTKAYNGFDPRSPTATLQRRALFNSSPRFSPLEKDTIDAADTQVTADTQNGNHSKLSSATTKETELIIKHTESLEILVRETNNNTAHDTETTEDLSRISKHSILCPATPVMRMKKSAFFTYRDNKDVNSPVVFDAPVYELPNLLNDSLSMEQRDPCDSLGYKERHAKISDTEKGLELVGRELAREQAIGWREYWDFLDTFVDIASTDGIQKLENHFALRAKDAEVEKTKKTVKATATVALDDVCSALEKFGFSRDGQLTQNVLRNGQNMDSSNRPELNSNIATTPASATTPYTCVEKSLQVFAKRMTKTIIHNIENVVCINDTLLSELKRLKSLICSFKEDTRFLEVNFLKVHSRIGNLISIYLQSSQEVTLATKAKILVVIKNLQTTSGERREHMECVCTRIFDKLVTEEPEQILPENLKTEDLCSKAWLLEQDCECQWDSNLSRKTSRRKRMEASYKSHQQTLRQLKQQKEEEAVEVNEYRSTASTEHDSSDEDVFWSDFGDSDVESDDVWHTPPDSPSNIDGDDNVDGDEYKIYIYGTEPTKRDLDVLNAIFHVDIDNRKYPHIHSWKTALMRFPNEEMDYFPSPAIIKKSHSFIMRDTPNTASQNQRSYINAKSTITSPQNQSISQQQSQMQPPPIPAAKRLFSTPSRSKIFSGFINDNGGGPPRTPFNKLRGLFSSYRDTVDSSPVTMSPAKSTTSYISDRSGSDESNNLSLLNISAAE